MDLSPAEVVGHTCYHFIHVEDLDNIRQSHEDCEPFFLSFSLFTFLYPNFTVSFYIVSMFALVSAAYN